MNPQNLSKVEGIIRKIRVFDWDLKLLNEIYANGTFGMQHIEFWRNDKLYEFEFENEDIKALIDSKKARKENLMKELEKL